MRFILLLIFIPLIYVFAIAFIHIFSSFDLSSNHQLAFYVATVASGIVLHLYYRRRSGNMFTTFEHELTHSLLALLTFNRPTGIKVFKSGGGMATYAGRGNFLITLSPYFFLTFTYILLPFSLLIGDDYMVYFNIALGITVGYHTASTIRETHLQQPDLKKYGYFFSFVVIILFNILSYGVVIAFINNGWSGIGDFFSDAFSIGLGTFSIMRGWF